VGNIIKKDDNPNAGFAITKDDGKLRIGSKTSPFQQRAKQAQAQANDAVTLPNRLCLMLDGSSSMNGGASFGGSGYTTGPSKMDLLHQAIENFVNRCNLGDTAIAIETFPRGTELMMTNVGISIIMAAQAIAPSGDTPMHRCVCESISKHSMTRGIIVSDGEATDWDRYHHKDEAEGGSASGDEILRKYKEAGVPIDTVHIGDSSGGEALLRKIAKLTGGVYCKFTDVSSFATAFAYLTPGYRAMLMNGSVSAADLGADEINR
jgi:hypothetical protein